MKKERVYMNDVLGNTFVSHIIMESLGNKADEIAKSLKGGKYNRVTGKDTRYMTVELKINGIAVNFKAFAKQLEIQHNRMIQKEAQGLILNRIGEFNDKMLSLEKTLEKSILKTISEKGIVIKGEDRY
jgi:Mg2+ and Co2+ transporter CorA